MSWSVIAFPTQARPIFVVRGTLDGHLQAVRSTSMGQLRGAGVLGAAIALAAVGGCGSSNDNTGFVPPGEDASTADASTPDATGTAHDSGGTHDAAVSDASLFAGGDAKPDVAPPAIDAGCNCVGGQVCTSGACACPIYQSFCNGQCIPTSSDANNCGGCGVQ